MTITERLELIRAGYTKEEIAAFDAPEEQKPEEQKPEEQKPEEQKPEEQKPEEQKPEEQKPETGNNEVLAAIAALTKAIQAQNMQKIGLDSPGTLTAEQALAQGVFGNK
jgi:outer membrane biosynthesis protein TonB